jgi:alpha/beta superfamily hydrolase
MHNNVVFRVARGLQSAGVAALRFNFRGAGASEGQHDGQGGEEGDVAAALDHLEREFAGVSLWGAGFSFGARTLASFARREPRIARLLLVALPVRAFDCTFLTQVRVPTHLLMSSNDQYGSFADLRERFPSLPANFSVDSIDSGDHFFRGQTPELERRVRAWADSTASPR